MAEALILSLSLSESTNQLGCNKHHSVKWLNSAEAVLSTHHFCPLFICVLSYDVEEAGERNQMRLISSYLQVAERERDEI